VFSCFLRKYNNDAAVDLSGSGPAQANSEEFKASAVHGVKNTELAGSSGVFPFLLKLKEAGLWLSPTSIVSINEYQRFALFTRYTIMIILELVHLT